MTGIHFVEIENFKSFGEKIHIDLFHPAVLIGPNNSGKTSVIQALALWSRGIKSWFEKTEGLQTKSRNGAGINRLNILEVPVAEIRFLWKDMHVRKGKDPITLSITVGIEHGGKIKNCTLLFNYQTPEVIYCQPDTETIQDPSLITFASAFQFHLLYPMSGIMSNISQETEETPFHDGKINSLLGQGQTAQVLRNICYKVVEQDKQNGTNDWEKIADVMKLIFLVDIKEPYLNEIRGSLILTYSEENAKNLDISLAGRGLQQVLLILAYLYWRQKSILMIDEPDAHLEILRQKQIYTLIKNIAQENGGQVIIATHSEVILNEALDSNLTLLLYGTAQNLAKRQDIKTALSKYGIENYYKAKVLPRFLYIEGSTDIEILKALAEKTGHEKARTVLGRTLNVYYIKNIEGENTLDNQLDRIGGAFGNYQTHFNALKDFVPELKGFGIFDSDNSEKMDIITDQMAITYWKNYEIENYFITPDVLTAYARDLFADVELFMNDNMQLFEDCVSEALLEMVCDDNLEVLHAFKAGSTALKRTLLAKVKMSRFAESVFDRFAEKSSQPRLLTKGEFYRLVPFCPAQEIPREVTEKLDLLVTYLEYDYSGGEYQNTTT